ncbi:Tex family protein [Aliamphritea spongicola]|uniref:Tex family protein n=1 Tax=Aliamphritea spongicola TaxID=707589 RepID=UPI00196B0338|nr:Tex family protein [Aliamphritea spongicola]MBN3564303.1 RNA-binding transcriptional accessory protein [Aliamphritea spongicola]
MTSLAQDLATDLNIRAQQAEAVIRLLDEGATVPFIARYRKEATQGLDDAQLRQLAKRLEQRRELNARRDTILQSIRQQDKLTPELQAALQAADTKSRLEDLYLPYKPKRQNKAELARTAGLQPLADTLSRLQGTPEKLATRYLNPNKGINTTEDALEGARQILTEQIAEHADLQSQLRQWLWNRGELSSKVIKDKQQEGAKFADYFDFSQNISKLPSHRALAILRAQQAGIVRYKLRPTDADADRPAELISRFTGWRCDNSPAGRWLATCIQQAWQKKLLPSLENQLIKQLKQDADAEAISVFSRNLKDLLLAAPAGLKASLGLDPGLRTGVKVAVLDNTGKVLDHTTVYPHAPQKQWQAAQGTLAKLCQKYSVNLIAIGNGTASRETEQLVKDLLKHHPDIQAVPVVVSEAGASVYSASELASEELPELDVSIRGAVSIARRLQDPLAELVKIEPKAIGVGQYQHDVDQNALNQSLEDTVEDCVNHVGADLNTASAQLLSQVAGLNMTTAQNIVAYRDQHGVFTSRKQLLKVPRLGPKAFEQCAGFLKISNGKNPLDGSAVHPEAYAVVERIAKAQGCKVSELIGQQQRLQQLRLEDYCDAQFGLYTLRDIIRELEKPGRDPRPEFRTASFQEGVETLADLHPGMQLEGCVTNVTNFGAFVDIGVHQDGLVHISQLADRFVKDPHSIVKTGDIVSVRVLEVDQPRKRISLSMKAG